MAFNKAATYHQMIGFLKQAGYDVSEHEGAVSTTDFIAMNHTELLHYAAALEATYNARSPYMDEQAILDEIEEVNSRLAGGRTRNQAPTQLSSPEVPVATPTPDKASAGESFESGAGDMAKAVQKGLGMADELMGGKSQQQRAQDMMSGLQNLQQMIRGGSKKDCEDCKNGVKHIHDEDDN